MIEEMMQQDLPNLVDERRFRRREPENFERDEFGRVSHAGCFLSAIILTHIAQMARREDLRRSRADKWL